MPAEGDQMLTGIQRSAPVFLFPSCFVSPIICLYFTLAVFEGRFVLGNGKVARCCGLFGFAVVVYVVHFEARLRLSEGGGHYAALMALTALVALVGTLRLLSVPHTVAIHSTNGPGFRFHRKESFGAHCVCCLPASFSSGEVFDSLPA